MIIRQSHFCYHEEERFIDLLGEKTSGLDDLCYSDDDEDYNDEEYEDGMDEEALRIEYSDRNDVRHGRCQTNFIPGGPKPPIYNGMSKEEMAVAKTEFRKVRKKYTDGLRIKRLREIVHEGILGVCHLFSDQWLTFKRVALRYITPSPTRI